MSTELLETVSRVAGLTGKQSRIVAQMIAESDWLAAHDADVKAAGVAEGIRLAREAVTDELPFLDISEASADTLRDIIDALEVEG